MVETRAAPALLDFHRSGVRKPVVPDTVEEWQSSHVAVCGRARTGRLVCIRVFVLAQLMARFPISRRAQSGPAEPMDSPGRQRGFFASLDGDPVRGRAIEEE